MRWLVALVVALALASPAAAQVGAYHQGLGDDTLSSEPRDVPGDLADGFRPMATPSQRGCVTDLISTNFSSRNGERPELNVAHYTVSSNVAGWSDVNAIRNWFNQSRAQASSNYIVDFEGNCKLIVPETAKAWTQGNFNPWSISIEFIATGKESTRAWRQSKGLRVGAMIFADAAKRWGIPLRWVNPSGCNVPTGLTDHERLECGNTHTDVQPNFPYTRFMELVREFAAPEPRFRFEVRGPGGGVLARSSAVTREHESERLARFLRGLAGNDERRNAVLRRLRWEKAHVLLHRVKVDE